MPEVRVARAAGFCFGVKRALDMVNHLIAEGREPLYLLGPLIHNPQVMDDLRSRGVLVVNELTEATPPGTLVIRTHGVTDQVIDAARERGLDVVDAICPRVRHVHKLGRQAEADGRRVLLFGEADHPEVRGIAGNLERCVVFESLAELERQDLPDRLCLLAQTTQSVELFQEILRWLQQAGKDVTSHDTICHATRSRQDAAAALAAESDLMIVVGGRESGNTQRLLHICLEHGPALHVETWQELRDVDVSDVRRIGVAAGASTPEHLVREVVDFLSS